VQFGGLQKPYWDNGSIAEEVRWGCDYYQKIVRKDGGLFDCVAIPLGWGPRDYYQNDAPAPAHWNTIRHQAMVAEYFKNRDAAYAAKCRQTAERVWRYMTSDKRPKGKYAAPAIPPRGHDDINKWFATFYEGSSLDLAHRIGAATMPLNTRWVIWGPCPSGVDGAMQHAPQPGRHCIASAGVSALSRRARSSARTRPGAPGLPRTGCRVSALGRVRRSGLAALR
jgi:hypothetical protein